VFVIIPINAMDIHDIYESIHSEFHFEMLETGGDATNFDSLQEFIEEEVLENWNLKLWQKKAIVENFELDREVLHCFYIIQGGKNV
jgi:hypothetical protein